ncbi:SGNH/GDSL hydrolase family protein [Aquabacterium sp.]|uniref:SGNH/GDSL hydrolase family protein n=1 Tax=Aquabacterium sp. TaxID=1872578 RepID=UPI0035C7480A
MDLAHLLATVALGPVLLMQGRGVRRRTPRLPEAAGPRTGQCGVGPDLRLLIVGDSAAAGVGCEHQDDALCGHLVHQLAAQHTVHWRLEAQTGRTTADTLAHLRTLAPQPADAVLVSLGVNDVTAGLHTATWLAQQAELVTQLRTLCGTPRIWLTAVPPVGHFPALPQPLRAYLGAQARRFNRALARWSASLPDVHVLDPGLPLDTALMASDGFHPGPAAHRAWAHAAAQAIRDAGFSAGRPPRPTPPAPASAA